MSMPTIEELIRLGCDRAGIGRDPRMLAAVKAMSGISNPDIARAAESYAYPAQDEFEIFTTAVVTAWHEALIAEAEHEHEGMMGPWPEGTGQLVADWLRTQKEDQE